MNAAGRDHRTLIRIAALLVALAALAERTGNCSLPVRWFVLCILGWAETVAHAFVLNATQANGPFFEEELEVGTRPMDAAWLAWRFRLLAAVLGVLLRAACRPDRLNAAMDHPPLHRAQPLVLVICGGWTRRPYDTS